MAKEIPEYTVTRYRVAGSPSSSSSCCSSNHEPEYRHLYNHLSWRSTEIRLLLLEPSSDSRTKIRCSLLRTSIDSGIEFEALSYTWGDLPVGQEDWIIIDDLEVPVRPKLWEALIHLRYQDRGRMLWVDALCINQDNVLEKNHQVMKMSQIYKAASRVVAWLGVASEDSTQALRFIAFIGQYRAKYGMDPDTVDDHDVGSKLEGVRRLCQRMYWKRLWIIQEVVVARKVWIQCGMECISWDDFYFFLEFIPDAKSDLTKCIKRRLMLPGGLYFDMKVRSGLHDASLSSISLRIMALVNHRKYSQDRHFPLEVLLSKFSDFSCSNVQDKVYGVYGLSCDATDLPVDYSKSNFDIFKDLIDLQRYNRFSHSKSSLLSFSQHLHRHTFEGQIQLAEKAYQEHVSIATVGFLIGVIRYMGPLHRYIGSTWASFQEPAVEELLKHANGNGEKSIEILKLSESTRLVEQDISSIYSGMSYAIDGGVDTYDEEVFTGMMERSLSVDEYKEMEKECIRAGDSWGRPAQLSSHTKPMPSLDSQQLLEYECAEPQLFVDDSGRIGVAPSNSREGDVICQFYHVNILAILRWQRDRYVFVGRATWPQRDGKCIYGRRHIDTSRTMSIHMNYHTLNLLTR